MMAEKVKVNDLLHQSVEWAGWEKHLCSKCKERIMQKMRPVQRAYNSNSILKRRWADARMAMMTMTLWKALCRNCIRKIMKEAGVKQNEKNVEKQKNH